MLITYVGLPGAGKSLWNSYVAYTELSRIMFTKGVLKKPFFVPAYRMISFYEWVVLNTDFDDGRGNFTRYCYGSDDCVCDTGMVAEKLRVVGKKREPHWEYGGFCIGVTDIDETYDLKNCLCLFDEGGTQFANTDWDKMPERYREFLTQHRKNITALPYRFDIYVYTQHKDLIEVTLRRISYRIYLIRPLFGFAKNPLRPNFLSRIPGIKIFLYQRHEVLESKVISVERDVVVKPEDQLESITLVTWYIFGKRYQKAYDTLAKIAEIRRSKAQN
jgi:hypothetical protein